MVYLGDLDGEFYAIDLANGKVKWKKESETGYKAPAGVWGDKVYAGDYDGVVVNQQDAYRHVDRFPLIEPA